MSKTYLKSDHFNGGGSVAAMLATTVRAFQNRSGNRCYGISVPQGPGRNDTGHLQRLGRTPTPSARRAGRSRWRPEAAMTKSSPRFSREVRSKNMSKYFLVVLLFTEGAQVGHPPERIESDRLPPSRSASTPERRHGCGFHQVFAAGTRRRCAWAGRCGGDEFGAPSQCYGTCVVLAWRSHAALATSRVCVPVMFSPRSEARRLRCQRAAYQGVRKPATLATL